jgi:hypothetical protein
VTADARTAFTFGAKVLHDVTCSTVNAIPGNRALGWAEFDGIRLGFNTAPVGQADATMTAAVERPASKSGRSTSNPIRRPAKNGSLTRRSPHR